MLRFLQVVFYFFGLAELVQSDAPVVKCVVLCSGVTQSLDTGCTDLIKMAAVCEHFCDILLRHVRTLELKNMALLLRTVARQGLCSSRLQSGILYRHAVPMGTTAQEEMNKFWTKNTRLNRPVSPHVSIYKWSVPMMMSISHRGTGVALSSGISVFALAALVLPESYPYYLDLIHSMSFGPQFLAFSKFALAFPVAYHTFNGIRHLIWDLGKGFKIPEVYRSGYIVIALTVLTSIGLAAM